MGLDYSELDAQLAALGAVRNDILQIARKHAGNTGSLAEVDELLSSLGSGVALSASAEASAPRRRAAQLVPQQAKEAAPHVEPTDLAPPAAPERSGPPHSEEIVLPDPVQEPEPSPQSGELSLDAPAPRSGSFALDPEPSESNLDEDAD